MTAAAPSLIRARVVLVLAVVTGLGLAFGAGAAASALGPGVLIVLAGWAHQRAGDRLILRGLIAAAEVAVVMAAIFAGDLFDGLPPTPAPMVFFAPAALGLLCLLAVISVGARPLLVWWTGGCMLAAWALARLLVQAAPDTLVKEMLNEDEIPTLMAYLLEITRPRFFNADVWDLQMAALAAATATLAVAGHRTRALARRAGQRQAEREALAAHFSSGLVETLMRWREAAAAERVSACVLDCDLVGFSAWAERRPPQDVAGALRFYHGFVEEAVFRHGGGVLKFTGDGVAALFGLEAEDAGAAAATACAADLARLWPTAAAARFGADPFPSIAVGVDCGEVVTGLVGTGASLSLVAIGAPVDGAAALQAATRAQGAPVLVSGAVAAALRGRHPALAGALSPGGPRAWKLKPPEPEPAHG